MFLKTRKRIEKIEKRLKMLECTHEYTYYAQSWQAPGYDWLICKACGKNLEMIDREERLKREYTKAKGAYDAYRRKSRSSKTS